jgi:hypothetical protein
MHKLLERLPLQFRVLYRQFLLRIIDLEALSIKADVVAFMGQFASVLVMFSLIEAVAAYLAPVKATWHVEQNLIELMMLVVGLIIVVSWDSTFPDRRDVMVLAPLPVAPHMILVAKMAASGALLGLAVLVLNGLSGIVAPFVIGTQRDSSWGFFQSFAAYWFTMIAATVFLYCCVLTVQGFTALLLPRRLFLRLSAILQLVAFGLFPGVYFLQPLIATPAAMAAPGNQCVLAWSPSYWFFALFNQLNGSLPSELAWLARRAWIGLGVAVFGAAACLLLCYLRTMKKTVEQPDLVPGSRGWHWAPRFGSSLQTAIVLFCVRSLTRSRYHRLAFAFYLAMVFGIALACLKAELSAAARGPVSMDFIIPTYMMMILAVLGLRNVSALPISLTANWVLRITQLCPSEKYIAATRRTLLLLGALPVWIVSALLSLSFRPLYQVAAHLAVLALVGWILVEIGLIKFYKVPFTCSYLPGKVKIQVIFWGFLIVLVSVVVPSAEYEQRTLNDPLRYVWMTSLLGAVALGLWAYNRDRARSAVLYFEELPEPVIMTLGLSSD